MSEKPDDLDFDRAERESAESDPDTNLILDYLANKLHPDDAGKLEERARRDKDFRYKLADLVLLKGLVMLALEKNPAATGKDCRRTQRMFLDYLKGTYESVARVHEGFTYPINSLCDDLQGPVMPVFLDTGIGVAPQPFPFGAAALAGTRGGALDQQTYIWSFS